jgi:DNA-binding transcriptional LysR family regulator
VISGVVAPEVNTSTAPIPNRPPRLLRVTMASDLGPLAPFVAEFLATYPAITIEIEVSVPIADLIGENLR